MMTTSILINAIIVTTYHLDNCHHHQSQRASRFGVYIYTYLFIIAFKVKEGGGLESAYNHVLSKEPEYTTWKVNDDDDDDDIYVVDVRSYQKSYHIAASWQCCRPIKTIGEERHYRLHLL